MPTVFYFVPWVHQSHLIGFGFLSEGIRSIPKLISLSYHDLDPHFCSEATILWFFIVIPAVPDYFISSR